MFKVFKGPKMTEERIAVAHLLYASLSLKLERSRRLWARKVKQTLYFAKIKLALSVLYLPLFGHHLCASSHRRVALKQ